MTASRSDVRFTPKADIQQRERMFDPLSAKDASFRVLRQ
jgi:hypothetical protein